jgi:uncharacterized protein (UPF0332 family)
MERVAEGWKKIAIEALDAARILGNQSPRGALNRAYYALFAHTHALLIEAKCRPRREFGTWSHTDLPEMVRSNLRGPLGREAETSLRQLLRCCRKEREAADYDPSAVIDGLVAMNLIAKVKKALIGDK